MGATRDDFIKYPRTPHLFGSKGTDDDKRLGPKESNAFIADGPYTMHSNFIQTKARFLRASQQRFTDWGEADNHRRVGAALDEFHDLFVLMSSYYQRRRWIEKPKPIWYRQNQLSRDLSDRFLGRSSYGRLFSKFGHNWNHNIE